MASTHGSGAVFKLDNYSGSLVDLSSYCDNVDLSQSSDNPEDTTFSSATRPAKGYLPGLKDGTISVSGPWDTTLDRHMGLVRGRTGTFDVGPDGSVASDPKYTGEAILTEYSVDAPVNDVIRWTATLQITGGVTKTTY